VSAILFAIDSTPTLQANFFLPLSLCMPVSSDDDLEGWNVSGVTTMRSMFEDCEAMMGKIEKWDVSNVEDMALMVCFFSLLLF